MRLRASQQEEEIQIQMLKSSFSQSLLKGAVLLPFWLPIISSFPPKAQLCKTPSFLPLLFLGSPFLPPGPRPRARAHTPPSVAGRAGRAGSRGGVGGALRSLRLWSGVGGPAWAERAHKVKSQLPFFCNYGLANPGLGLVCDWSIAPSIPFFCGTRPQN